MCIVKCTHVQILHANNLPVRLKNSLGEQFPYKEKFIPLVFIMAEKVFFGKIRMPFSILENFILQLCLSISTFMPQIGNVYAFRETNVNGLGPKNLICLLLKISIV